MRNKRFLRASVLLSIALLTLSACHKKRHSSDGSDSSGSGDGSDDDTSPTRPASAPASLNYSVTFQVIDETGAPLPGADIEIEGTTLTTDATGFASLSALSGPVALVVSLPGYLDEPLVVDREMSGTTVVVPLWAEVAPGGARRVSMHMAGDVMLGRRYVAPTDDDTITVTPGDESSARKVVDKVAPIFRAAMIGTANVETVVGTLPDSGKYPGKLFTLQSVPVITALLDELGLDLAILANNHIRDWQEAGVASTTGALDAAGIPRIGAGLTEAEAAAPATIAANGLSIGFLAYCSISGDSANDSYALDTDPEPGSVPPESAYEYEFRSWGFTGPTVTIPTASRRVGSAWVEIAAVVPGIEGTPEEASLWASAIAVYPELQDWVARRGHGGANLFRSSRVAADVAALRTAGADLVVVQMHSGFNTYIDFHSVGQETFFRAAIDAGADIVVGHHPHVLNGIEIYNGRPIIYSLGNFVFDQDFLPTFSSAFLRVVYEDATLLEARLLPITLHRYLPVPVAGNSARDITRILHERSTLDAVARRLSGKVVAVLTPDVPGEGSTLVNHDGNSTLVSEGTPASFTESVDAAEDRITRLDNLPLTRSRGPGGSPQPGLRFGKDLFRWGHLEDEAADGASLGGFHWKFPAADTAFKRVEFQDDPPSFRVAFLHRKETNSERVRVRPVARVNPLAHRLFTDSGGVGVPADGPADWSIAFRARYGGGGAITLILDVSHFDTSVPNEEPVSAALRTMELPVEFDDDDEWHDVLIDIPPETWDPVGGLEANQALIYVALYPPDNGKSELLFDDLQFLEWRDAASLPDAFYLVDAVRLTSGESTVTLERRGD